MLKLVVDNSEGQREVPTPVQAQIELSVTDGRGYGIVRPEIYRSRGCGESRTSIPEVREFGAHSKSYLWHVIRDMRDRSRSTTLKESDAAFLIALGDVIGAEKSY